MDKKTFIIDGNNFSDYKGFADEFSVKVFEDYSVWGGGFASLSDLLNTEFKEPIIIHWLNSHKSAKDLGYESTFVWMEAWYQNVHPSGKELWKRQIELAKNKMGITLFLMIVDIITSHKRITLILD